MSMAEKQEPCSPDHIVIVSSPGMGHVIPFVHLANRLLETSPFFTFSFMVPTIGPPSKAQKAILATLPSDRVQFFFLPVSIDDIPHSTRFETRLSITLERALPALRSHLLQLTATRHRLSALVSDLFATDAFDYCPEFNMKPYIFFPSSAMCLSLFLHLPHLDSQLSCDFRDLIEPVRLPGCIPVHGKDLLDPLLDRKDEAYKWILHLSKRYRSAEGILVNSFNELEKGPITALQLPEPGKPLVYPVGPLVHTGSDADEDGSGCLKWLDAQPRGSVLFVSFGSVGTHSCEQLAELAHGLEMSQHRFLWVVRAPNNIASGQSEKDPLDFIPQGFIERTKERGLVIQSWAPQVKVLNHGSTGGFLTHCGWNSFLESVVDGVPLITWPLYAEQKMNAVMLTDGLEVALRPKASPNGLIERGEIAFVVKGLMEGEDGKRIKNKMRDLKDAAAKALTENGSSTIALHEVALKWKSQ